MFGFLRNAAVIGVIAHFSPVHDQTPEARLDVWLAAPSAWANEALKAGPGLAIGAIGSLDPASRAALAQKIAELDLANRPPGHAPRGHDHKAPNGR